MRLERFTLRGQEAIQSAIELAERNQHQQVEPEHLLVALLEQPEGIVRPLLGKLGANLQVVLNDAQAAIGRLPKVQGGQQYFSPRTSQLFTAAQKLAEGMQDEYVSTEHLLLAIVDEKDGAAGRILRQHGVSRDDLMKVVEEMRGGSRITDQNAEQNYQALSKYAKDLTELARQGKLDPVIGRDDEIRRTVQVLSRRTKNNPVLIDELHTLVGAGAAEGAIDASNMLKPALARGELRCVGATTLNEYKKHIEKDAALERRFQVVYVGEPTVEDTIAILRGLKERYEVHHGVRIKDSAIVAAATLSNRYITDRFLPDKAIDLIDEAASRLRIEIDSMPAEMDEVRRKVLQLQIEEQGLKKETDPVSQGRRAEIEKELAQLSEKLAALRAHWENEKQAIAAIRGVKQKIEDTNQAMADAERKGDLGRAAELKYGVLPGLQKDLDAQNQKLAELQKQHKMLKEEVDAEDIAYVVSKWTGIPVSKILEAEMQKIVSMEERLQQRVVGQEEAVRAVSNAVRRARS